MIRQFAVTVIIQPRPETPGMMVANQDARATFFGSVTREIEKTDNNPAKWREHRSTTRWKIIEHG